MLKLSIVFFTTILLSSQALAHTQLTSSVPENGSIVTNAPKELILTFENDIRLTKVILTQKGVDTTKLKLDKKIKFQTNYRFILDDMNNGDYSVEWRGLGEDGHVMKGTLTYSVK